MVHQDQKTTHVKKSIHIKVRGNYFFLP